MCCCTRYYRWPAPQRNELGAGITGGHADPTNGYRNDLAGDPGPLQGIINSPADAIKAVREHYKQGDDLIRDEGWRGLQNGFSAG